MDRSERRWWISGDRRWRQGEPPAGWYQGADRRWYPPADSNFAPTEQMATIGGSDKDTGELALLDTPLPRVMVLGTLVVLVAVVCGILAISSMGSDGTSAAEQDESPAANATSEPSVDQGYESAGTNAVDAPSGSEQETPDDTEPDPGADPDATPDPQGDRDGRSTTTTTSEPPDRQTTTTTTGGPDDGGGDGDASPADCPPGRPDHPRCQ